MGQIRSRIPVCGLLASAAVFPTLLLIVTGVHMVMFAPVVHIIVVGVAGLLAGAAAIAMSVIAARLNDGRAVWLGMAFSVIATLLVIHALATPGAILPANGLVQLAGGLNLPIGGAILAASGLPVLRRPRRVKLLLVIQLSVVGLLALAGAAALVFSRLVPVVPEPSTTAANVLFVIGGLGLGLLAWRAGQGHTRRVATLAVSIGERLGLPDGRLRQLALGGLLHDMGKLSVPNPILNKPGRLTDDEFAEIRRHPGAGRQLLTELGGFPPLVLDLVESHHERLDGGGYPNRVRAGELDLAVRILTVADVYDALTADRVYREAWPAQRALALLDDDTGSAFEADCVAALRSIVAPTRPAPSPAVSMAPTARAAATPVPA